MPTYLIVQIVLSVVIGIVAILAIRSTNRRTGDEEISDFSRMTGRRRLPK